MSVSLQFEGAQFHTVSFRSSSKKKKKNEKVELTLLLRRSGRRRIMTRSSRGLCCTGPKAQIAHRGESDPVSVMDYECSVQLGLSWAQYIEFKCETTLAELDSSSIFSWDTTFGLSALEDARRASGWMLVTRRHALLAADAMDLFTVADKLCSFGFLQNSE